MSLVEVVFVSAVIVYVCRKVSFCFWPTTYDDFNLKMLLSLSTVIVIVLYCPQAQLRFCLLETSCEQEDHFPPSVNVKINNKMCPLPVSTTQTYLFRTLH